MKTIAFSFFLALSISAIKSQTYKNEISLGYDAGVHLLFETLGESFFNQCDDENGCDRSNYDYGVIRFEYKRFISEKFNVGVKLNYISSYITDKQDNELIVSSNKYFIIPVYVEYNYKNTDRFRLSSAVGGTFALGTEKDEILNTTELTGIGGPILHVQLINATWTFGKRIHPYISVGLGSNLLSGGVSYRF